MLSIGDAHRLIDTHLGTSARAVHSQFVGRLMRRLAERTGGDPVLWELVGLCHDLDFEVTAGDWSRHGLVAAEWLADDLPSEGLDAIKAHDHRTGVTSSLPISHALKLADALAIAHDRLGNDLVLLLAHRPDGLAPRLANRPHLPAMIVANAAAIELPLPTLAAVVSSGAIVIGKITPETPGFPALRQQCTSEGHRMLARFKENWRTGSNRFDAPGELVLGATLDDALVGLAGRNRDPYDPWPRAGRVRHLYVDAAHRRLGVGRQLIGAIVEGAAEWFDYLNTNSPPGSASFYERLGFAVLPAEHITHRLQLRGTAHR